MNIKRIQEMTLGELVDRFVAIALAQDEALLDDKYSKYNRLFDKMELLSAELKAREGDQRSLLIPLLKNQNAMVRLKAAIATLALVPQEARAVLQALVDDRDYPAAMYASGMLRVLDDGSYVPS